MLASVSSFIKDQDDRSTVGHSVGSNSAYTNTRDLVIVNTGDSNVSLGTNRTSNPDNIISSNHAVGTAVGKGFLGAFADATGGDIVGDIFILEEIVIIIGTVPNVHLVDVSLVCPFVVRALLENFVVDCCASGT